MGCADVLSYENSSHLATLSKGLRIVFWVLEIGSAEVIAKVQSGRTAKEVAEE